MRQPARFAVAIAVLTVAAFSRVGTLEFTHFDDDVYVTANPMVLAGLTASGVRWAFTTAAASNYHPLTWLSHMADVSLFGQAAAGHHLTSALLHLLNAELLLLFLWRATGAPGRSAFVAAAFAVHPLRVESVAWVAERKDLLGALFALLAMLAYLRYARRPSVGRYGLVALLFVLALLSKPMAVTLPFVLLLLDLWPLGRLGPGRSWAVPLLEKLPVLALAAAASWVTYVVQTLGPARPPLGEFPAGLRLANAVVAYVAYLGKTAWPAGLSPFYPHPGTMGSGIASARVALALGLLTGITVLVALGWRRRPHLAVGWLWFLGMLVPAIGLVQVGGQSMADRYTYLPMIGILIGVAWEGADVAARRGLPRTALVAAAVAAVLALATVTWRQTGHWRNDATLFGRALAVDGENWLAWNGLGLDHQNAGRVGAAMDHYREAIRIKPDYAPAWYNLGRVLDAIGRPVDAAAAFRRAVEIWPAYAKAWLNLGVTQAGLGELEGALASYREALRLAPEWAEAWYDLGLALAATGDRAGALEAQRRAVRLRPDLIEARQELTRIEATP